MKTSDIRKALDDLRDKAVEAHAFGDGFRVNHLCSIALDFLRKKKPKLTFRDVRWVFILSAYWASSSELLLRVRIGWDDIKYLFEHKGKTDRLQQLFEFVFDVLNHLEIQNDFPSLNKSRKDAELLTEDYALFEFAFEMFWFFSQGSTEWKNALEETTRSLSPREEQLANSLVRLRNRLEVQSSIVKGAPDVDIDQASDPSSWLAEGWIAFHSGDWQKMDEWIRANSPAIRIDHKDYSAFWTFVHFSRMQRVRIGEMNDHDDQFVSIARRYLAEDRQVDCRFYENRRLGAYEKLISQKNENDSATESAIRLLSLNAIAGLRKWDYGNYRSAISRLCRLAIEHDRELFGDPLHYWAVRTLFRLTSISASKKDPQVYTMFDRFSASQIGEIVEQCLDCAPIQIDSAFHILGYISDLIDTKQHSRVISWFFDRQNQGESPRGAMRRSWLETVVEILRFSPNAAVICREFSGQIIGLAESSDSLEWFESLFLVFLEKADLDNASRLVETLIELDNVGPRLSETRWRIIFKRVTCPPKAIKPIFKVPSESEIGFTNTSALD